MNTPDKIPAHDAPIYRIGELDRFTIVETPYTWISSDAAGHVLAPERFPERLQGFLHSEFHELIQNGGARIETDFYAPVNIARRKAGVGDVPEKEAQCARFNAAICDAFLDRRERGEDGASLSDASLARVLPELASEAVLGTKGDRLPGLFSLPSPRAFRRLLETYVESKYQPLALASTGFSNRSETPTFGSHDFQVWNEFAAMYAGPGRPTMANLFVLLKAALHECNLNRCQQGLPPLTVPSRRTFERFIRRCRDPFASGTGAPSLAPLPGSTAEEVRQVASRRVDVMFRFAATR